MRTPRNGRLNRRNWPLPRAYADWREMLAAEQPEVVTVGPRWTDCHLEMVLACLEVGAHVYCEKPMTWSLAEGDQIVAKAEATGLKVAVAHQGAYLPLIRHVKEVLAQGRIGAVHWPFAPTANRIGAAAART